MGRAGRARVEREFTWRTVAERTSALYQTLLTQNAVPEQQVATQKAAVTQGEGTVKSDQAMIDSAARDNTPLFLPPGNYNISNLTLPDNTRITGVPGASRLVYSGDGHLMSESSDGTALWGPLVAAFLAQHR